MGTLFPVYLLVNINKVDTISSITVSYPAITVYLSGPYADKGSLFEQAKPSMCPTFLKRLHLQNKILCTNSSFIAIISYSNKSTGEVNLFYASAYQISHKETY